MSLDRRARQQVLDFLLNRELAVHHLFGKTVRKPLESKTPHLSLLFTR
jgi:hypothetical protein